MGMYDDVICKYPLPIEGANKLEYQTKDTPNQFLDLYEIREDGTLWHEAYDIEDHSDPNAEGFMKMAGMMTRVNKHWEQEKFTGEIRFYTSKNHETGKGWIEWSSYFVEGKLKELHLLSNTDE